MGVFWATRSISLNDIFDSSMARPLLIQGDFRDGGGLPVLLVTGPDPRVCAAQLQQRIFQQPLTTIAALGRCEDAG